MLSLPSHNWNLRTVLMYALGLLTVGIFVAYILFQARFLLAGPTITLYEVRQNPQTERVVYLEGTVANIVRMTLNGRQIYTDKSGYFKEALILENGYTIATLSAEDRYGRVHTVQHEFVYAQGVQSLEN